MYLQGYKDIGSPDPDVRTRPPGFPDAVGRVRLSRFYTDLWRTVSGDGPPEYPYLYKFTDLRSLDPSTLYDPLLSIPKFGVIPKEKTVFQMTIPCTGKKTAIASMYIVLHIHNSLLGRAIPGSPIKLHLRKRCIAFESKRVCHGSCLNGGVCNDMGRCDCPKGYYGDQCQFGVCHPPCINGGTCITNNSCICLDGYMGQFCQRPYCEQSCGVNGFCADVNKCECYRGWRGRFCHKTTRNLDKQKDRKGKRKKIRHSRKTRLRRGKRDKQGSPREKKKRRKLFVR
ncbi:hypothetical protein LSH36_178g06035 [Paralvinella palmiformis]|uniref:Wnt inhibitory factor 1 n=1 Tax=Paralvinella palmiformis TaxID=53620 RepID=A0AAD9JT18_9ANNE|nr:hypothetical protein LSH36_178g06035 [Paralvinella palmiformis]